MIMTRKDADAAKARREQAAEDFNRKYPVGTRVRYWTGPRGVPGLATESTVRARAEVMGGHTAVVWVTGRRDWVALTHVEALEDKPASSLSLVPPLAPAVPAPKAAPPVVPVGEPPVYSGKVPFVAGSETSRAAAKSIEPSATKLLNQVMECFRAAGEEGLTSNQVELQLGLRQSTASARVRDLVLQGWLDEVGRRKTASGRTAIAFKLRAEKKKAEADKAPAKKAEADKPANAQDRLVWAAINSLVTACGGNFKFDTEARRAAKQDVQFALDRIRTPRG